MATTSDRHTARLAFWSASGLIADARSRTHAA